MQERELTVITHMQVPPAEGFGPPSRVDMSIEEHVDEALGAFERHYSADSPTGVYRQRAVHMAARQQLLATLPRRLTPRAAGACEGPTREGLITPECLKDAVHSSQLNKAPGDDGLPIELYLAAPKWRWLGPMLAAALNEGFRAVGEVAPLTCFLNCTITLVGKPRAARDVVKGYRPITLLDVSTRLLCLVLAKRLQLPLDLLIDATQSAFIGGRDISDNLMIPPLAR